MTLGRICGIIIQNETKRKEAGAMRKDKQPGGIAGTYQATSRGFGFVTPEKG